MQLVFRLKGVLKIAAFFILIVPPLIYTLYKTGSYARRQVGKYRAVKKRETFQYNYVAGDTSLKGYLLFAPYSTYDPEKGMIMIMDGAGHILAQKNIGGSVHDFRQWKVDGHICYSYGVSNKNGPYYDTVKQNGHIVILDSALQEVRELHFLPGKDTASEGNYDLDKHDFILLSGDHYVAIASHEKIATNIPACLFPAAAVKVIVPIIQEVLNNTVVWQWDASGYPEFFMNSGHDNQFYDTAHAQDYIHLNGMAIDPIDSNLVVSLHNLNQLIKIDRHTGRLLWRLGGINSDFPLSSRQRFLGQHNVRFIDSGKTLLLFDNGEASVRAVSRVLEFQLDEKNKAVTSFKALNIPEPFSGSKGSVEKLGDDYLICGGSSRYILRMNSITGAKKMELHMSWPSYRAFWVNDINGVPLQKIKQ